MPSPVSSADALRRLIGLRWLSVAGMMGVLLLVPWLLDIPFFVSLDNDLKMVTLLKR